MIDQYGPQILDMISSKLDSDQICKVMLFLCLYVQYNNNDNNDNNIYL